jgi:hypothetical protein
MAFIEVLPAFGTLFLEVFKEIKATLDRRKNRSPNRLEFGTLLELYGSTMKLSVYSVDIKRLAEERPAEVSKDDQDAIERFFSEVAEFGRLLREMNLQIVDIYYPSFTEKILMILGADWGIADNFNSYISNQRFKNLLFGSFDMIRPYLSKDLHEREDAVRATVELANALEECSKIIADIVKENWDFKELIELDSTHKPMNS